MSWLLSLAACGDNKHVDPFQDASVDTNAGSDASIDAPPDALMCGANQMICNDVCVNTQTDNNNCGTCGNSCGSGTCQQGLCCPAGQTNCGGTCVDLTTSNTHCGTCNNDCGSGTCQTDNGMTTCCPTGQTNCNGTCVDLQTDEAHCGSCPNACGSSDSCCGGSCINTQTDNANCGACNNVCDTGMGDTCKSGTPATCCGTTETNCSGTCSLLNDNTNCGACGTGCNTGIGESCKAPTTGTGVACCTASQNNCGGSCSDPMTDELNCGGCAGAGGVACSANETCLSGICCGPGETNCNGVCVDLLTDNANCGQCTMTCSGSTPFCNGGACADACDPTETDCSGDCVNTTNDPNNCGGCGTKCAANQVCNGSTCTTMCDTGETNCNGACVNLTGNPGDPNHCGTCTTVCAFGDECVSGVCQLDCQPGQRLCGGVCVDPQQDEQNCGGCAGMGGTTCGSGQTCDGGVCCDAGKENVGGICCTIGFINCGGQCFDPKTTNNHCGNCSTSCTSPATCDNGVCCGTGLDSCDGMTCTDTKTDEANCGACGSPCGSTETCDNGLCCGSNEYNAGGTPNICCPIGSVNCNGVCTNLNDPTTCGTSCGNAAPCQGNEVCNMGTCTVTCSGTQVNCNGQCVDLQTDENFCGSCTNACLLGQTCSSGTCGACPSDTPTACGDPVFACVDPSDDAANCGDCSSACVAGEHCSTTRVIITSATASGTTATFTTQTAHLLVAGDEVIVGGFNQTGYNGGWTVATAPTTTTFTVTLTSSPVSPATASTRTLASVTQSGNLATFVTTTAHVLAAGDSITVTGVTPTGYNGTWIVSTTPSSTSFTAVLPTSGLAAGTGGTVTAIPTVRSGSCCGLGLESCGGTCLDLQTSNSNCGACGNVCGNGSVCVNGACTCGFGQISCGTGCITPSVDPLNCGACGNICGVGMNNGEPYCVSGGCVPTCPAPLTGCPIGTSSNLECVNTDSDSDNCGGCGIQCLGTTGCSAGQCVPTVPLQDPPPEKCIGGGPPIQVPDDNGSICTGSLGATSFTFGLCARTNIGPISRDLITDAFDSTSGPYVDQCTTDPDCGPKRCAVTRTLCSTDANCDPSVTGDVCAYLVTCVGGTCAGGGVGVNGVDDAGTPVPVSPVASNSAYTHVGGAFWVFGTVGLAIKGNTDIKQRFYNQAAIDLSKTSRVWDDAWVRGDWTSGGNTAMQIDGMLTTDPNFATPACPNPLPGVLTLNTSLPNGGCTEGPFPNLAQPCGTRSQLIDIKKIVRHYANPANNDNMLIDLDPAVLDNPQTSLRIDLPCGVYYFNSINAGKSVTIVVNGRTAIIVGGAVRISQKVIFDVQPTASLDIFAGGVLNVSNDTTLGSPAYPRLTRFYLGDDSCKGGGGTLTAGEDFTDCCSGVQSGGVCVAGGGNLSQAISLSQGGNFNGLLWGGYGTFTHSNPLEMYGSIFTNHFDASGETIIHYDNGAVNLGEECPQPLGSCESCRDCNNQACVNNQCGSCTSDSQCCPPLICRSGACVLQ